MSNLSSVRQEPAIVHRMARLVAGGQLNGCVRSERGLLHVAAANACQVKQGMQDRQVCC